MSPFIQEAENRVIETFFNSKDITVMSLFGAMSSLVGLTTTFIPAPLPGLYGLIAVPAGTIFLMASRVIVGKNGAATFTQLVSGVVSTFLPGGPPLVWVIIPTWVMGGVVMDLSFIMIHRFNGSRLAYGVAGAVYNIPGDLLLYWAFNTFLFWGWPMFFFIYGFVLIHSVLGGLAGVFVPDILDRIKPVTALNVKKEENIRTT
jgi:hypothetical protein